MPREGTATEAPHRMFAPYSRSDVCRERALRHRVVQKPVGGLSRSDVCRERALRLFCVGFGVVEASSRSDVCRERALRLEYLATLADFFQ